MVHFYYPPPKIFNGGKHYKKVAKIILLTVLWSFLILGIIKMAYLSTDFISWKEYIKIIIHGKTGYVINQYWFLKALIMVYLFFPLLKWTFDNDKTSLIIFGLAVALLTFGNNLLYIMHQIFLIGFDKPISEDIKNYIPWYNFLYKVPYAYALVYFIMGGFIYRFISDNKRRIPCTMLTAFFIAAWILSTAISLIFETKMKWDPCFDGYGCVMTLIMSCCLCLFLLQATLNINHYLDLIAKNTLGIYLTHGIIIYATKPILSETPQLANLFCQLIYSSMILVVSLLIVLLLKRIPYVSAWVKI